MTNRVLPVSLDERNECTVSLAIRELNVHALSCLECVVTVVCVIMYYYKLMQATIDIFFDNVQNQSLFELS